MPETVPATISLRNLGKSYREGGAERVVFRAVGLDVGRGEIVAVLGRSGSGKSTLLNIVSGIDLPTAGEVEVDGTILNGLREKERTLLRRRRIGIVFQFFNLIPTLTVIENLLLPLSLSGEPPRGRRPRAMALLERVGLADRHGAYPDALSGGEQQRIAVARALVHGPPILLADEPTGNLDGETGRRVIALLTEVVRERGTTLLVATHSAEVARSASRTVVLADGTLRPGSPGGALPA